MKYYKKTVAIFFICIQEITLQSSTLMTDADTVTTDQTTATTYSYDSLQTPDATQDANSIANQTTTTVDNTDYDSTTSDSSTSTDSTTEQTSNVKAATSTALQKPTPAEKIQTLQTQNKILHDKISERQTFLENHTRSPKTLKTNPALASSLSANKKAIQEYQNQINTNNKEIALLQTTSSTSQEPSKILGKLQTSKKQKKKSWYGKPKITL